jgi:micrococcal nuclease
VLDRAGAFGYRGDDWNIFDQQAVEVVAVTSGEVITVLHKRERHEVRLIGVDAPDPGEHWHEQSREYTKARIHGRQVMLKLDSTETRDEHGRLLAYVFFSPGDNINLDLVRNGLAYADRRVSHTHRAEFEQIETPARTRGRGLWRDVTESQMPAWRREWLAEWHRRRMNMF